MLSGIGVKSLQVYSSVKNAYTFTNWFGGGDPEKGITPQSGTNPVPTTFLMGLKVSF
jgi:hypothetical protein